MWEQGSGAGNPFSSLFSGSDAQRAADGTKRQKKNVGDMLARVLLLEISESMDGGSAVTPKFVVFLQQLSKDEKLQGRSGELNLDNFRQGMAERLQMAVSADRLCSYATGLDMGLFTKEKAVEPSGIRYLAECYARAMFEKSSDLNALVVQQCKSEIIKMSSSLICSAHSVAALQPRSHTESVFVNLLLQTLSGSSSIPLDYFREIADAQACPTNLPTLKTVFDPVLAHVFNSSEGAKLSSPDLGLCFSVLEFFSTHGALAKLMVNSQFWLPQSHLGGAFETHTLIGRLLRPTSLSSANFHPSEYFSHLHDLYQAEVNSTTASLQLQLESISERMHRVFDGLLRACPETKKALISWLVECFKRNENRAKMMSRIGRGLAAFQTASDGFFLNLSWVMLLLSAPFTSGKKTRLLNIDASYCCAERDQLQTVDSGGPLVDFTQETKLVTPGEGVDSEARVAPGAPFNFVTHCFFLTHRCLILGMTQVLHRFEDVMRMYGRVRQRLVSLGEGGGEGTGMFQQAQQQFRVLQSQLLGLKAHAMHPKLLDLCLSFYTATAQWLVQLTSHDPSSLFPLPDKPPVQIQMVPECLVENMADFAMFLRQSQADTLASASHHMHHLITFVTVFMGNSQFLRNPHIRAKLAQLLSLMIPRDDTAGRGLVPTFTDSQKELFESHELASKHLIEALLKVFIDIEFTGESMEFEAKFQYRIPMYEVLEFLWSLSAYRPSIIQLSQQAIESHEHLETPVFLRFINMMMNDATVQLDEGLENLVKIKEIQDLKESEEWDSYSEEQKKQQQQQLNEATMMARNRNLLAQKTVHCLEFITTDCRKSFVIPTMVDRMAAMLNYVLAQLVGPKSRELRVRDASKYHFNPKDLVSGIITIYLNLGKEQCFCEALPRDGRSFSMELFPQAERVLRILSKPVEMITELQVLAERVRQCQEQLRVEEENYDQAPEEFLDPVTNEVMRDPVDLPTSGITMDRANIIRHLLSDECDPFNRAPLTADMLKPNHELKRRIEEWREQVRRK